MGKIEDDMYFLARFLNEEASRYILNLETGINIIPILDAKPTSKPPSWLRNLREKMRQNDELVTLLIYTYFRYASNGIHIDISSDLLSRNRQIFLRQLKENLNDTEDTIRSDENHKINLVPF